jgi:hypothetical protein
MRSNNPTCSGTTTREGRSEQGKREGLLHHFDRQKALETHSAALEGLTKVRMVNSHFIIGI